MGAEPVVICSINSARIFSIIVAVHTINNYPVAGPVLGIVEIVIVGIVIEIVVIIDSVTICTVLAIIDNVIIDSVIIDSVIIDSVIIDSVKGPAIIPSYRRFPFCCFVACVAQNSR